MKVRTITLLLALLVVAGAAYADYSADLVTKHKGSTQTLKLFCKDDKFRLETPDKSMVIIARKDKGVTWFLSPKTKTYREFKGCQFGNNSAYYSKLPGVKCLGAEKANGYMCKKYQITRSGKTPINVTTWVSDELGAEVRSITRIGQTTQSSEMTNIKKKWLWGISYDIPKGYKKSG